MCWCTPEIRTPFCGKAHCTPPPPKSDVSKLQQWVNSTPERRRAYAQECFILAITESIYAEMERKSVTKADLAKALGTSKSNVTQLLTGARNMTLRTLVDIANALGVIVSVVLTPESPRMETRTGYQCPKCNSSSELFTLIQCDQPGCPRPFARPVSG